MSLAPVTRILIADDHALLRGALADVLHLEDDFEVVAEAGTGRATVEEVRRHRPDIVLLDVEMPSNSPAETVTAIADSSPGTAVIVLTMHDDDAALIHTLVEKGIRGFLHKGVTRDELVFAIRSARSSADHVTISASRRGILGTGTGTDPAPAVPDKPLPPVVEGPLSQRELQILTFVGQALSNQQIATRLGITESTVKRHLRNIFQKLGAVSRLDAYNKATGSALLPRE